MKEQSNRPISSDNWKPSEEHGLKAKEENK